VYGVFLCLMVGVVVGGVVAVAVVGVVAAGVVPGALVGVVVAGVVPGSLVGVVVPGVGPGSLVGVVAARVGCRVLARLFREHRSDRIECFEGFRIRTGAIEAGDQRPGTLDGVGDSARFCCVA